MFSILIYYLKLVILSLGTRSTYYYNTNSERKKTANNKTVITLKTWTPVLKSVSHTSIAWNDIDFD